MDKCPHYTLKINNKSLCSNILSVLSFIFISVFFIIMIKLEPKWDPHIVIDWKTFVLKRFTYFFYFMCNNVLPSHVSIYSLYIASTEIRRGPGLSACSVVWNSCFGLEFPWYFFILFFKWEYSLCHCVLEVYKLLLIVQVLTLKRFSWPRNMGC